MSAVPIGRVIIPPDARTVLVYGGSFDPPHRAHIELPLAALKASGADWLLYLPNRRSPHKARGPVAGDADRVAMLAAALAGQARVGISTLDIEIAEAGAPNYALDSILELAKVTGANTRLRLLIGADQAEVFHRWHEPRKLIELAEPLVMLRAGVLGDRARLRTALIPSWPPADVEAWLGRVVATPQLNIDATRLRALLEAGRFEDPVVVGALPAPVLAYIRSHGLYRKNSGSS